MIVFFFKKKTQNTLSQDFLRRHFIFIRNNKIDFYLDATSIVLRVRYRTIRTKRKKN